MNKNEKLEIYLSEEDLTKIVYFLNNILESKGIKINPECEEDFILEHDFYTLVNQIEEYLTFVNSYKERMQNE